MQRQLRLGQIQRKQWLLGTGSRAGSVAIPHNGHQRRGICRHLPQPLPARHKASSLSTLDHPVIELRQGGLMQPRASLGKGSVGGETQHAQRTIGGTANRAKQVIKPTRNRQPMQAKQAGDPGRRRQFTRAGKGPGEVQVPRKVCEGLRGNQLGKVHKQGLGEYTALRPPLSLTSKFSFKSTIYIEDFCTFGLSSVHWCASARLEVSRSTVDPHPSPSVPALCVGFAVLVVAASTRRAVAGDPVGSTLRSAFDAALGQPPWPHGAARGHRR